MKRLLVVILSLVYFAASSGFTLRQHYCMGELIGTAIDHPAESSDTHHCTRCGMEKKSADNGCCKDKVKTFKASDDQLPGKSLQLAASATGAAIVPVPISLPAPAYSAKLPELTAAPVHGPPDRPGSLPLYLQVRCLLL